MSYQYKRQLRSRLYVAGIISSLWYTAMNIFIPLLQEHYDSASQTVSELSAIGAPTRTVWVVLSVIYTVLIISFGWGIWKLTKQNNKLRIVGILIFAYGITNIIWPFAPMHQREALAAGAGSFTDTMHLTLAAVTVAIMTSAIGLGAAALGKSFRIYSISTIFLLLVFGILTSMDAPKVQKNLPLLLPVYGNVSISGFSCFGLLCWLVFFLKMKDIQIQETN